MLLNLLAPKLLFYERVLRSSKHGPKRHRAIGLGLSKLLAGVLGTTALGRCGDWC